ncbi:MAG: hypothetical protein R3F11_17375 [Verrucomicrobiales bacterium]
MEFGNAPAGDRASHLIAEARSPESTGSRRSAGIGQLTSLANNLGSNPLAALPPEIGQLTSLTWLYLGYINSRRSRRRWGSSPALTEELVSATSARGAPAGRSGQLTSLTSLGLESTGSRRSLRRSGSSPLLTRTDLGPNQFSALPPEIRTAHLAHLARSHRQPARSAPPEIGQLTSLTRLYLGDNQLAALPPEIQSLKLKELFLHRNPQLDLPPEILGPEFGETLRNAKQPADPRKDPRFYFSRQTKSHLNGKDAPRRARRRGKTSIADRLLTNDFRDTKETEGITITDWKLNCPGGDRFRSTCGIGGQEILHGTHQFFLSSRSSYLLVLTGREGSDEDDAHYWLRMIEERGRSASGKTTAGRRSIRPADRLEQMGERVAPYEGRSGGAADEVSVYHRVRETDCKTRLRGSPT